MHILNQMDPGLARESRRREAELWERVLSALDTALRVAIGAPWSVEPRVSVEEIFADLAHGRD